MSDNRGNRIWQGAVLLLVLCNIGLVVTMWLKPPCEPRPAKDEGGHGPRNQVVSSLRLTAEQIKQYDLLIEDHQQKMRALKKAGAELKQTLFSGIGTNGNNSKVSDSLTAAIGANQQQIELVTYNHFAQVRALCTDQQKQEFDKIIVDVTSQMGRGPGGHRPPPDREGPPEGGTDALRGHRPGLPQDGAGGSPPNQK